MSIVKVPRGPTVFCDVAFEQDVELLHFISITSTLFFVVTKKIRKVEPSIGFGDLGLQSSFTFEIICVKRP